MTSDPCKPQANQRRAHYRRAAAGAWPAAPPPGCGRSPAAPCRHASRNCVTTVSIHARPNGQAPSRKATWPPLRARARPRALDRTAARSVHSLQAEGLQDARALVLVCQGLPAHALIRRSPVRRRASTMPQWLCPSTCTTCIQRPQYKPPTRPCGVLGRRSGRAAREAHQGVTASRVCGLARHSARGSRPRNGSSAATRNREGVRT